MKFKLNLLLVLGLCLFVFVGCNKNEVSSSCVEVEVNRNFNVKDFKIIKAKAELEKSALDKYDDEFFKEHSLVKINVIEEKNEKKIEITSYDITFKTLTIKAKTTETDDDTEVKHWNFYLELSNNELNKVEKVKIYKNDVLLANSSLFGHYRYGSFTSLKNAYESNYLTNSDLAKIDELENNGNLLDIDSLTKDMIENDLMYFKSEVNSKDDIASIEYYGNYNGYHVIKVDIKGIVYPAEVVIEKIGDYEFNASGPSYSVWHQDSN